MSETPPISNFEGRLLVEVFYYPKSAETLVRRLKSEVDPTAFCLNGLMNRRLIEKSAKGLFKCTYTGRCAANDWLKRRKLETTA